MLKRAHERLVSEGKETVLFIDEVHRFSKSQQDALLPSVENRDVTFIAATTENPSFSSSRCSADPWSSNSNRWNRTI